MSHSQRRDVLKAAGTVAVIGGLAGCAEDEEPVDDEEGEAPADEPEETQEEEEHEEPEDDVGAFRVAHTSPDAPNVDIYFDEQAVIEDLAFREVSPYEEVEPGTYQVQVTAADDPDTVVFDEEVEVEAGVTNTAVAFGEAAGGPENEFTVEVLEDDISDPGDDTSRVRLFHASPDAEDIDIVVGEAPEADEEDEAEPDEEEAPEDEEPGEGEPEQTQQEDEPPDDDEPDDEEPDDEEMPDDEPGDEPEVGDPLFEGVGFGDSDSQELPAGDYTLEVVPAEAAPDDEPEDEPEDDEPAPDDEEEAPEDDEPEDEEPEPQQQEDEPEQEEDPAEEEEDEEPAEEPVAEFELSTESQTVYSAFAVGYVNPEEAMTEEEEEFEVVTVEDAQEGERADGGTNDNGLLTLSH